MNTPLPASAAAKHFNTIYHFLISVTVMVRQSRAEIQ